MKEIFTVSRLKRENFLPIDFKDAFHEITGEDLQAPWGQLSYKYLQCWLHNISRHYRRLHVDLNSESEYFWFPAKVWSKYLPWKAQIASSPISSRPRKFLGSFLEMIK